MGYRLRDHAGKLTSNKPFQINHMEQKQVYASPEMKVFTVHLQGNCCQALSNPPIDPYTGTPLGDDIF